jgi:hypothetical protein
MVGTSPPLRPVSRRRPGQQSFYGVFGTRFIRSRRRAAPAPLTGAVPGSDIVTAVRNNAANPDIVFVSPGDGAFWINGSNAVVAYPDVNVGQPNAVVFHKGFFIFTYGNGTTRTSNVNVTTINVLNSATAESKPDTLYRPIPLANGQLLLCGSTTLEVWGGANDTGYPFSYIATIARGIVGPAPLPARRWFRQGHLSGRRRQPRLAARRLFGAPISNSDLDTLIERESDKSKIRVGVFNSRGHGFVTVQGPNVVLDLRHHAEHLARARVASENLLARSSIPCRRSASGCAATATPRTSARSPPTCARMIGTNAIQSLVMSGIPTGGTFTLTFNGQTTTALNFNATARAGAGGAGSADAHRHRQRRLHGRPAGNGIASGSRTRSASSRNR